MFAWFGRRIPKALVVVPWLPGVKTAPPPISGLKLKFPPLLMLFPGGVYWLVGNSGSGYVTGAPMMLFAGFSQSVLALLWN